MRYFASLVAILALTVTAGADTRTVSGSAASAKPILFANLSSLPAGGIRHCTNCTATSPCGAGGTGAYAIRAVAAGAVNCFDSAGMTTAAGDARYWKLAGDNDPVTGALTLPAGTTALPALNFTGSPTTGFSAASDLLSVSTAAVERWVFNTSGGFNCASDGNCVIGNGLSDPSTVSVKTGVDYRGATSGTTRVIASAIAGSTTTTLPNASSTLPIFGQQATFTGLTAPRSFALPDSNQTLAALAGGQTFTSATWNATPVAVLYGGTGAATAGDARTNLSLGNVDNTSDATKNAAAVTLTNKSIALGSNTVSGTLAELNAAITDAEIARTDASNTFTGNQGFGGAPSGVAGQVVLVTDNNDNNTFVRIYNSNAAGTSAAAAMATIADTASLSAVSQGSARTLSRWGAAVGGWNEVLGTFGNGLAVGTTGAVPLKLGTAGQAREYFFATPKTLTESSATGIAEVSLANNTIIGGTLYFTIEAKDATDYQALRGSVPFVAVSKAGTITATLGTPIEINAVSAGTLTNTTTITTGAAKITLNLNAVSSLTQTTLRASFRVVIDGGSGNATGL